MNSVSALCLSCAVLSRYSRSDSLNKVLQILIFCVPFYDFLESVGRRSRHSFKDVTPILDVL